MEHLPAERITAELLVRFDLTNGIEFLTDEQLRDLIRYCEAEQIMRRNNLRRS